MGVISHSAPIFIIQGTHENEEGWNLDDTPSKALLSINARKRYYPNPIPDSFYTENTDNSLLGVDRAHLRGDYFAWTWGDALFVVIDPYEYTLTKPFVGTAGGEEDDETLKLPRPSGRGSFSLTTSHPILLKGSVMTMTGTA